ncbi:MAG: DUF3099 domain-containing protein [Nocardioidaceae bacterium]
MNQDRCNPGHPPPAGHTTAQDAGTQRVPTIDQVDRKGRYFALMGTCLTLIILAWFVVRFYSTTAAIVMSALAMVIPPVAAMVGNRRS